MWPLSATHFLKYSNFTPLLFHLSEQVRVVLFSGVAHWRGECQDPKGQWEARWGAGSVLHNVSSWCIFFNV